MPILTEVIDPNKTDGPRAIRFNPLPGGGVLLIDDRKRTRTYSVREFVPDSGWHGRAFHLTKSTGERRDVFLAHDGHSHHCDCEAGTYRPAARCCHVEAMLAVAENGWLPGDAANPDADHGPTEVPEYDAF